MDSTSFLARFDSFPKKIQKQIIDYTESILGNLQGKESKTNNKFRFDWESGISDIKSSSVELQHKANDWR